jgi:HPt (histidine-containing phosphotransfer) domain-containing protein
MGSTLNESGTGDVAVKSRLNELAQKFVTRTTGDVALMREDLARLAAGDRSGLDQIRHLAHRACGTGGTLGLSALSDAAAALEKAVDACPAGSLPDDVLRAEIAARIEAMAAQLR